jgi:signal peptidase I
MTDTNSQPTEVKKKSGFREWLDSVVFAVVAATIIRWLIFTPYTIPTGSMESTLLINDFLFVSNMHYGARTPSTPLQIPLTHQKIWFTDLPSYTSALKLPSFRVPNFGQPKNNDVVVFNYPGNPDNEDQYGGYNLHPVDLRTNYIKRCIGTPGDVLEIKDAQVYINNVAMAIPPKMQQQYLIETKEAVNERIFKRYEIKDVSQVAYTDQNAIVYLVNANKESIEQIKTLDFVKNVQSQVMAKGDTSNKCFPYNAKLFPWNRDNFGPLTVPKKGVKIVLDEKNIATHRNAIIYFDGNENAKYENGKILIDGKEIKEYTFKQDYFFMMGDNRHASDDSRYWGFVPYDHVVGKAMFTWMSFDTSEKWYNMIRWNRIFKSID